MSWFGNYDKDNLESAINDFLETHTMSEMLEVVAYCVECKERELKENMAAE